MHVMDLSARSRPLEIIIEDSVAYELVTSLHSFRGEEPRDPLESGGQWLDELRAAASPGLVEEITAFDGGTGKAWICLWNLVFESAAPKDIDAFFTTLEAIDPVTLRMRMFADHHWIGDLNVREELLRSAVTGDLAAQQQFLESAAECCDDGLMKLFRVQFAWDPALAKARLIAILRRWYQEVFRHQEPRLAPILARDAEAKRRLARTQPPDRLIELATNGLRYTREAGVQRVLLFPSVLSRPWILISGYSDVKIFCYPAAEESLSGVPPASSTRLIAIFKALSDERRLQTLQRLASRSYTLQEIADELGVGKSLMHHHLRTLRVAGLIRVRVGDRWRYEMRTETVEELPEVLGAFLSGSPATAFPTTEE